MNEGRFSHTPDHVCGKTKTADPPVQDIQWWVTRHKERTKWVLLQGPCSRVVVHQHGGKRRLFLIKLAQPNREGVWLISTSMWSLYNLTRSTRTHYQTARLYSPHQHATDIGTYQHRSERFPFYISATDMSVVPPTLDTQIHKYICSKQQTGTG